jgi:hypothetical protein
MEAYEAMVYPGTPEWRHGKLETNDRIVRFVTVTCTGCEYRYRIPEDCRPLPICPGCCAWMK